MTNYQHWIDSAAIVARNLHKGQTDKGGVDYFVGHLSVVAHQGRTWLEKIAGYLHDASEDTPYTVEEILSLLEREANEQLPFPTKVELTVALQLLNHNNYPERSKYIEAIGNSPLATAVKLNDLRHNMDLSRISNPQNKDCEKQNQYKTEYEFLKTKDIKPILYVDMDNVLVNFESGIASIKEDIRDEYSGRLDEVPGIFILMKPMEGAIEAVERLSLVYDVYILSTAPWLNPTAWSDKLRWIQRYFGQKQDSLMYKRLILSHHKNLNQGAILIDDRTKNGVDNFLGQHIHFGTPKCPDWQTVLTLLNC